jgi:hypothetical protein
VLIDESFINGIRSLSGSPTKHSCCDPSDLSKIVIIVGPCQAQIRVQRLYVFGQENHRIRIEFEMASGLDDDEEGSLNIAQRIMDTRFGAVRNPLHVIENQAITHTVGK